MPYSQVSPIVSLTAALFLMIAPEPARQSPSNLADQPAPAKPAAGKDCKPAVPNPGATVARLDHTTASPRS